MTYPIEAIASEEAVIGGLLLDPCVDKVMQTRLTYDDFSNDKLAYIFNCILEMKRKNKAIDVITVKDYIANDKQPDARA